MPNKKEKNNATKKTPKNGKNLTLKLDNGAEERAKIIYVKDNSKCFKINEIDFNKIRVGFTAKNIIYTNIMCFMSTIMNTPR